MSAAGCWRGGGSEVSPNESASAMERNRGTYGTEVGARWGARGGSRPRHQSITEFSWREIGLGR
jgi:hypothetical protein